MSWIGGYTADRGCSGIGISALTGDLQTGYSLTPAVKADSPAWLGGHPLLPVVYATLEGAGDVAAFRIDDAELTQLGDRVHAGQSVCQLEVDPAGAFLIASCWGDGAVVRIDLAADGSLGNSTFGAPSTDPYSADPPRQSRAHAALRLVDGRWATTDLGHDQLRLWSVTDGLTEVGGCHLPRGSGPRHLVGHPDGRIMIIAEYSCEVLTLEPAGDGFALTERVCALADHADTDTGAGLRLAGDRLYAAIRGSDLIITLDVSGTATVVDARPSGGATPRDHVLLDGGLAIAHQGSDELTIWSLDANGIPDQIRHRIRVGSPTTILPGSWARFTS